MIKKIICLVIFLHAGFAFGQGNHSGDFCGASSEEDAINRAINMRSSAERSISMLKNSNDPENVRTASTYFIMLKSYDQQLETLLKQREQGASFKPHVFKISCESYAAIVSQADLRLGQENSAKKNPVASDADIFLVCTVNGSTTAKQIVALFDDKYYLSRVIEPKDGFDLLLAGSYESKPPFLVITEKMGKFLSNPNPSVPKGWLNNTKSNAVSSSNYLIKTFRMKKTSPDEWDLGYVKFENWNKSDAVDRSSSPSIRCKSAPANIKQMMVDQRAQAPSR
ncbi:MAG TPA: hypothetical protein PLK50_02415 [Ottowia sp.]|uniref:hypothetical protein n=1 Tax=Ottowia sp. TaxID=1898956 RepID=UPI002BF67482|nr:hypothetical protein [Ottowia sp.]HPZ56153.1 hypothetical protein [Ottowia sp.]